MRKVTLSELVVKRLNEYLFARGQSMYAFARDCGVSLSTLKNMLNGHTNSPSLALFFRITEGLGVSPKEFLDVNYLSAEYVVGILD